MQYSTKASQGQSRGGQSPPSPCEPPFFWCSPGHHWPSRLLVHTAASCLALCPPDSPSPLQSCSQRVLLPVCTHVQYHPDPGTTPRTWLYQTSLGLHKPADPFVSSAKLPRAHLIPCLGHWKIYWTALLSRRPPLGHPSSPASTWTLSCWAQPLAATSDLQEETIQTACSGYCKNKCPMLIVGDSPLEGIEAPLSQPDSQELCCFLGAKVRDTAKRVLQLIKRKDYYPLLLFREGMNDSGRLKMGRIKKYCKALGAQLKNTGAQYNLPVGGKREDRNGHIMHINSWLRGWYQHQSFDFYNSRTSYEFYNLPGGMGSNCVEETGQPVAGSCPTLWGRL